MYRKGLIRGHIADLTGTAPATIGYHLGLARTQDPGLQNEHETAARKPAATGQGRERLGQLVAFVQDTGRYPARRSDDVSELTVRPWRCCRAGGAHPAGSPMRHGGSSCSLRWPPTGRRGRTGRAIRPPSPARSMSSASGCTRSGSGSAAASSTPPRSRLWTPPHPGGGPEERAAGSPSPRSAKCCSDNLPYGATRRISRLIKSFKQLPSMGTLRAITASRSSNMILPKIRDHRS